MMVINDQQIRKGQTLIGKRHKKDREKDQKGKTSAKVIKKLREWWGTTGAKYDAVLVNTF